MLYGGSICMVGIFGVWIFKDFCYKFCKFVGIMDVCDGCDNFYFDGFNYFLLLLDFGCC